MSVPFGENDGYDLIVDDGTDLHRVQCKTVWENKDQIYRDEINAFLVRHPDSDRLYWVSVEDATDGKRELQHDATIDHPSINWADEYEFDGTIP